MDQQKTIEAVDKANCALKLERKIVGVKFLFDQQEYEHATAKRIKNKMPYCVMVKTAMSGTAVKAALENFGCLSSARALGIMPAEEMVSSGRHYRRLGLYYDFAVAKNVQKNMTLSQHQTYGVMIKPLHEYNEKPDVVLIITNPYNAMRIIQGYTYMFGYHTSFKMAGNQAVCSECTAYPLESNSINVSLLCSGTRYMGGWGDDELALGIPYNKFAPVVEGLYATINPIEPNEKKAKIEARAAELGRKDLAIEYNKNYYTGLYLK